MRILVDIDGVCADLCLGVENLLKFLGFWRGLVDPTAYSFMIRYGLNIREYQLFERAITKELPAGLEPIPGAVKGVNYLYESGHEVVLVTQPWDVVPGWMEARRDWIIEHLGGWFGDQIIFTHRKEMIRGDVLIEDNPETILRWRRENDEGLGLLVEHDYNNQHDLPGVSTWAGLTWLIDGHAMVVEGIEPVRA